VRKITSWLALILIFIIPWEDGISISTIGSMARLMGFIVAAFWVATTLLEGRFRKPHSFHVLALLFFLWNFVSIFWSLDTENTIQRIKTYSQIFLLMLIYWDVLQKPESLMAGLQAYVYGSYVLILSTIYNYIRGNVAVAYEERYSATGINANELTLILIIGLPIAMQLFFTAGPGKKGTLLKLINLAYVPLAIYSIVLTGSRTSLIAIIPFGLFMVGTQQVRGDRKTLVFVIFLVSLLILFTFLPQSVINRLGTIGRSIGEGDLGGRIRLWQEGIAVLAQHPLLGIGSGAMTSSIGAAVHNTLISIAAETGLIGLILFTTILGIVIYQVLSLPKGAFGLWLAIFAAWLIGVLTLSWEFRKLTWVVLSFVIIAGSFFEPLSVGKANDLLSVTVRPSHSETRKSQRVGGMLRKAS
jgi:O-antigen ligase